MIRSCFESAFPSLFASHPPQPVEQLSNPHRVFFSGVLVPSNTPADSVSYPRIIHPHDSSIPKFV